MAIDLRNVVRGMGGTACAASAVLAVASLVGGFTSYSPAAAASASANKGDIWIDVAGSTDGPETDPHLPCTSTLWIWGMKLEDASGPVAIQGWPPSGGGASDEDWSSTWHFDTAAGGQQVIAEVDVATLLATARANGDTPQSQQGFHFKIDLEDPRTGGSSGDDKYKTFWIDCTTSTPTSSVSGSTTSSTTTGTTTTETTTTESTTTESTTTAESTTASTTTATGSVSASTTTSQTPTGSVSGIVTSSSSGAAGGVLGASVTTPNTGGGLPLAISGGLMLAGIGLLAGGNRMRRRGSR